MYISEIILGNKHILELSHEQVINMKQTKLPQSFKKPKTDLQTFKRAT